MAIARRVDSNQSDIVKSLREIPGISVDPGHDDILVGFRGKTYWYEIKALDAISPKTRKPRPSEITQSERNRCLYWNGHYKIVWTVEQILEELNI